MSEDKNATNNEDLRIKFTAWITKVVHRAKIDYIRKEGRHKCVVSLDSLPESEFSDENSELQFESANELEFSDEKVAIAYSARSFIRRKILTMLFVRKMTAEEIARELGCTVQNVYNQRSIAIKEIKQRIGVKNADD